MLKKLLNPIDLTKGNIYKVIVLFAIPIFISYLLQQVYVLTDSIIIGQNLTASEVNGVNDIGSIHFIVLQFAFGCSAGFSVVSSNLKGKDDLDKVRQSFIAQTVLGVLVSLILMTLSFLLLDVLLGWVGLFKDTGGLTYESAKTYLTVTFFGIICLVLYNQICSLLRSIGDSVTPLIFLIFSSILNIALDLLFIIVFKMGVAGAAIATVLAQGISAICCYVYAFIKYPYLRVKKNDFKMPLKFYGEHLKLGLPLAFQFSILGIGLVVMQATIVKFDTSLSGVVIDNGPAQLAFGAVNKLQGFLMCPLNALCTAMLAFTGQNKGAEEVDRIKKGIVASFVLVVIISLIALTTAFLLLINDTFMKMFYSDNTITEEATFLGRLNIFIAFPFYIPLGMLFALRGVVQGMEKPLFPFLAGIFELVARCLMCMFGPLMFVSEISSELDLLTDSAPIAITFFADPFAWMMALIPLFIGTYISLKDFYKDKTKSTEK